MFLESYGLEILDITSDRPKLHWCNPIVEMMYKYTIFVASA